MTESSQGASAPAHRSRARYWLVGMGALVAVLALALFVGNPFAVSAQGTRGMGPGMMGPFGAAGTSGFGHGIRAVVTGVDTGANTITLAGLPQQITTVTVDNSVKLVTLQADGTTKPAAIGDFKSGALVRIGIGRGNGSNSNNGAQPTGTPGAGAGAGANRGRFGFAINELAIVPDNIAEVSGLVLANNNGTYTIASNGGLRLTIKTQGSTTYAKNRNGSAQASDVKVGSRITVSGTQAPDGITANTVRVMDFSAFPMGNGNGNNGNSGGNGTPEPRAPRGPRGPMPGANGTPAATATT